MIWKLLRLSILTEELDGEVEFDGHKVKTIKFDLEHINRGWDTAKRDYNPTRRSDYTAEDIVEFFEQFGYYSIEWEDGKNKNKVEVRGKWRTRYFAIAHDPNSGEPKKMVIDIPEDFENEGIIVTLY
ncbi:MAG: hypothetical protein HYV97_15270 [Bdellovibrio sp.]|nr:hypothetical protein [Bdellovibrio sp.]